MAYEIGSGSKALTLPNPFKTHNVFLLASACVVGIAALYLLFEVRQELAIRNMVGVPFTLAVATTLLVITVGSIYTVLSQLKFYFGRARPADLTHTMHPDHIKETLRQQALVYEEPRDRSPARCSPPSRTSCMRRPRFGIWRNGNSRPCLPWWRCS